MMLFICLLCCLVGFVLLWTLLFWFYLRFAFVGYLWLVDSLLLLIAFVMFAFRLAFGVGIFGLLFAC